MNLINKLLKQINIIGILFLITLTNSYSFSLNNNVGAAFDKDEVIVNVSNKECVVVNKTPAEILELVKEATNRFWNTVPTSRLRLKAGSLVKVSKDFSTEPLCITNAGSCTANPKLIVKDQILISCNDDTGTGENFDTQTSILALALPNNFEGDKIKGAVILLNDLADSALVDYPREEFIAVLSHEIGHAIGLGHSPVEDSLMYYKNHPNRKYLGLDDMDGVSYLYPRSQPIGCGTIQYIIDSYGKTSLILSLLILLILIISISKIRINGHCPE